MFLRGDVAAAPYVLDLEYTPDLLFRWPSSLTNLHRAAWFVRVSSRIVGPAPPRGTVSTRPPGQILTSRAGRQMARKPQFKASAESPARIAVSADEQTPLGILLDRFAALGAPVGKRMLENGFVGASNGQVVRFQNTGMLGVETPRAVALCGELPTNRALNVGSFTLVSPSPVAALMAVSLDGKALDRSRHYVVKMVSRAENTNQALEAAPPGAPGKFRLKDWGKAPVRTFGRSGKPVILKHNGRPILSLALEDGTWELLVKDGRGTLVCDTGGIRGTLLGKAITTMQSVAIEAGPASTATVAKSGR
jgi:hypothetical protein